MFEKLTIIAAIMFPLPAYAGQVTYTGQQQVGTISASYSFTTDGYYSALYTTHILSYSVNLSDELSHIFIGSSTGADYAGLAFATPEYFLVDTIINTNYVSVIQDGNSTGGLTFYADGSVIANISDASGSRTQVATHPRFFAFATPSVPEPASWAMMVSGFGMIGAAMRRRNVTVGFTRCAAGGQRCPSQ